MPRAGCVVLRSEITGGHLVLRRRKHNKLSRIAKLVRSRFRPRWMRLLIPPFLEIKSPLTDTASSSVGGRCFLL